MIRRPERRVPTQARAKERHERILGAAAAEIARVGLDATTIEAIAERAGTSVGSIYQFFGGKEGIFQALVMLYLDGSRALFEGLLLESRGSATWETLLDRAIDAFAAFDREGPLFRAIWTNWHHAHGVAEIAVALNREFARQVQGLLATFAPRIPKAKRPVVATTVVEVMSATLLAAARSNDRKFSDAMVAEAKVVLRCYLTPLAGRGVSARTTTRRRA